MKRIILIALIAVGCTRPPISEKKITRKPKPAPEVVKCVNTKPIVVAVIDTGLGWTFRDKFAGSGEHLCKFGHKNFTAYPSYTSTFDTQDPVPLDHHGHGTNIAGIIADNAGNANYCMVILKYYDPVAKANDNLNNTIKAINYATQIGADFINYSGGGTDKSEAEAQAVKKYLDNGGRFLAAAGNERSDLEKNPYYPALDDPRVISVGNLELDGKVSSSSNYGKLVSRWEIGTGVIGYGIIMTGTSQATAVATGKIIFQQKCKNKIDTISK